MKTAVQISQVHLVPIVCSQLLPPVPDIHLQVRQTLARSFDSAGGFAVCISASFQSHFSRHLDGSYQPQQQVHKLINIQQLLQGTLFHEGFAVVLLSR